MKQVIEILPPVQLEYRLLTEAEAATPWRGRVVQDPSSAVRGAVGEELRPGPLEANRPAPAGARPEFGTVAEVARRWRVSLWTIYRWCADRRLASCRVHGRRLIRWADVETLERRGRTRAGSAVAWSAGLAGGGG